MLHDAALLPLRMFSFSAPQFWLTPQLLRLPAASQAKEARHDDAPERAPGYPAVTG